jgi:hypothetical protein
MRSRITSAILVGVAALIGISLAAPASARVFVGFGFGVPLFAPWYYPPPVYVPPPVAYTPPPIVYEPPTYVAPQEPVWYYCDNPRGYYPYVGSCREGWRTVPATPPRAAR